MTTLACERLVKRVFVVGELPSLIEAVLSSRDSGEIIRRLPRDDAQSLIDVIDEARSSPTPHLNLLVTSARSVG